MSNKNLLPARHFVDAGYIDAELLVESAEKYDIELFGPPRLNASWQARTGGYDTTRFAIDWHRRSAMCPEGKQSVYWHEYQSKEPYSQQMVKIKFKVGDCRHCLNRTKCVKTESSTGRQLSLPSRPLYEALAATRKMLLTDGGRSEYRHRAGIEGTLSQAVRRGTLRQSRYRGLHKTHLQESVTAAGINLLRTISFLNDQPLAKTRTSRFAKLAC